MRRIFLPKDSYDLKKKSSIIGLVFIIVALYPQSTSIISSSLLKIFDSSAEISVDNAEVCQNELSTITFTASGGVAPYTFTYNINGDSDETISTSGSNNSVNLIADTTVSGDFIYTLASVEDNNGEITEFTNNSLTITVNPNPIFDFTFDNDNMCSGTTINFTSTVSGTGDYNYLWDFGDGNTSDLPNPTHIFDELGCGSTSFNVTLIVENNLTECTNSVTKPITVKLKPELNIFDTSGKDFSNCGNSTSSSIYSITVGKLASSSCIVSYEIDWGDGDIESNISFPATHVYTNIGIYNMVVTTISDNDCSIQREIEVKNISNPAGSLVNPGATQNLCAPTPEIGFSISTWGANSLDTTYEVNYGDGTSIIFTQNDLITSEFYNTADPLNSLNYPVPHSYLVTNCPSGTYTASLNIQNACGGTESYLTNISVLEAPIVDIEHPEIACVNTEIEFINNSEYGFKDNCENSGIFTWDFGDGTETITTSSLENQNHSYSVPGTYSVTLTVQSFCGEVAITQEIFIEPVLIPSFELSEDAVCAPLNSIVTNTTDLTGQFNTPEYNWSVSYEAANCGSTESWNFTNGTDENSENPAFNFSEPGNYTITLGIDNSCGTTSASKVVTVKKPPTASIEAIADSCGPITINPVAIVENCTPGTSSLSYNWTFTGGNPATSVAIDPGAVEYTNPGNYTVSLVVTNECGVSNTATESFEIFLLPEISNTNLIQLICSGEPSNEIIVTSNDTNTTYSWSASSVGPGLSGFISSGNSNTIPSQTIINSSAVTESLIYTVIPTLNGCEGLPVDFEINVDPTPSITNQPEGSIVCENGVAAALSVSYFGVGRATYRWYVNTVDSTTGGTAITGATSATYDPPTAIAGILYYYVIITFPSGGCSEVISNTAKVEVVPLITINTPPSPETVCVGGQATILDVNYTGGAGTASYQWYSNTSNSATGGTSISGATGSSYTPPVYSLSGTYYYYVEISLSGSGCGVATSEVYQVEVVEDPVIDTQALIYQELCQDVAAQDLVVIVSGGAGTSYSYQWYSNTTNSSVGGTSITGATSSMYTPSTTSVGTMYYYVEVSQTASGCSVLSAISTVQVNALPTVVTQPISSIICEGGTATQLLVSTANGVGTPTYQWYVNTVDSTTGGTAITGATSATYDPPTAIAGILYYYVIITFPSGGCSNIVSETVTIEVNQVSQINSHNITICSGATFSFNPVSIVGNVVPAGTLYTWLTPVISPIGAVTGASNEITPQNEISQTLINTTLSPATISYVITPISGLCIGNDFQLNVTVNPIITSNVNLQNNSCSGVDNAFIETNITGGIPFSTGNPYQISWSGPNGFNSNAASIYNLEPGNYTLTIDDEGGCPFNETYVITEPDELIIVTESEKNISCFNGNDGEIKISITGGTLDYNYNWTTIDGSGIVDGAEDQIGLTAGTYNLEVEDKNGCKVNTTYVLTESSELQMILVSKTDVLCFGDSTGEIEIDTNGGTPFEVSPGVFDYNYSWIGSNGYSSNLKKISNLLAGMYSLTITDDLGCEKQFSIEITQPDDIVIDVTKTNITCNGVNDGSIDISISGGLEPYTITWNNLAIGTSQNNLSAGIYTVTIIDFNNCIKEKSVEITQPFFQINPIVTQISCFGANDGSIDLNIIGGVAPITVNWLDGSNAGVERNNLAAGTYSVVVQDSDTYQCPIEVSFIIVEPLELALNGIVTDALDCNIVNSGSIQLQVVGGTAPYNFLWNYNNETTQDLTNIPPGTYLVEVEDAYGCVISEQFSVIRQDPLVLNLEVSTTANCEKKEVLQETIVSALGGFPPYTFTWSGGTVLGNNNEIMITSQNGAYTVWVTDAKGCIAEEVFTVNTPELGTPSPSFTQNSFSIEEYGLYSINDLIQFTNTTIGEYISISWNFGDNSVLVFEENPSHTYTNTGSFIVTQTIETEEGCIYIFQRTFEITKGYQLIIPNAFSPNKDGINDTIRPFFKGMNKMEMSIYDTWGALIYFEEGLELEGWDGTLKGNSAENGNYMMVVRAQTFYEKEITKQSPITLLK